MTRWLMISALFYVEGRAAWVLLADVIGLRFWLALALWTSVFCLLSALFSIIAHLIERVLAR